MTHPEAAVIRAEPLAESTSCDTAPVTVERQDYTASEYGDGGGSGGLSIEVE
jgi:hypothetical protein